MAHLPLCALKGPLRRVMVVRHPPWPVDPACTPLHPCANRLAEATGALFARS